MLISSTITKSISGICFDLEANKLLYSYKFQRKKDQWSSKQKSDLICSILKGYPIGMIQVSVSQNMRQFIIDGIQRISNLHDYKMGKFKISNKVAPITIETYNEDGTVSKETFQIAGKKFDKLDPELKKIFNDYQITINMMANAKDEELREMFLFLNQATPMNNAQKNNVLIDDLLRMKIDATLTDDHMNRFWMKVGVTNNDIKKDIDRHTLICSLYALSDFECGGFKDLQIKSFLSNIQGDDAKEIQLELFGRLCDIVDAFEEALTDVDYLKNSNKLSIPCFLAGAKSLLNDSDKLLKYSSMVKLFFENEYTGSVYEEICQGSGTASKESVNRRIEFFAGMAESILKNKKFVVKKAELK